MSFSSFNGENKQTGSEEIAPMAKKTAGLTARSPRAASSGRNGRKEPRGERRARTPILRGQSIGHRAHVLAMSRYNDVDRVPSAV